MKVSVIVAVKGLNDFLKECIQGCLELDYQDYEVIVLPDKAFSFDPHENLRIIPTGVCLPAEKRDMGSKEARGDILAFLDDDAYPSRRWLSEAVKNFHDPEVAAVGGCAITPPQEQGRRLAGGLVYSSYAVSGNFRYRYTRDKRRIIDDYPSCNFLIRKSVFEEIGGFKTHFWPGEDTILCLEITRGLNKTIVYDPQALVFHHRRPLYSAHLRQIKNYALHRGYFVKRFPETSLRWQYFVPSVFLLWCAFGSVTSVFNPFFKEIYLVSLCVYGAFVFFSSFRKRNLRLTGHIALGIFLTHVVYGFYFLAGLMSPGLAEEDKKA